MKDADRRQVNESATDAETVLAQTEELVEMLEHSHPVYAEQLRAARRLVRKISAELDVLGRPPRDAVEVLAVPFELLRVAQGNPLHIVTTDDEVVVLRLPTREEYRARVEQARAALSPGGPPSPSDADIDRLIAPLRLPTR